MEKIRILIVESNPTDLDTLRGYLAKKNTSFFSASAFQIQTQPSIYEALVVLKEQPVDLVLLDLDLPDYPAFSALKVVHNIAPDVPVVALSSNTDEESALRMIDLGAQDYLFKQGLTRHQLLTAIYYGLERQRKDLAWRKSEARFRVAVDNMLEGFAIFKPVKDSKGKIVDFVYEYVNDAGSKLNLTPRESLIGKKLLEFLPNYRSNGMFDEYIRVMQTGAPLMKEISNYQDTWGGVALTRSFDIRAVKLEEGLAIIWRDITEQKKTNEQIRTQAEQMAALYQTSLEITSRLDLDTLVISIVERAVNLTGVSMGFLYLLTDENTLKLVGGYNLPGEVIGTTLAVGEGLSGKVAQSGQTEWVENYPSWEGKAAKAYTTQFKRLLAVPLILQGRVIGVISIADTCGNQAFTEDQVRLVRLFADQAAIAIENGRLFGDVQQLSLEDELTGTYNRRGLFQLGDREVDRSLRYHHPLAVIIADLDHFKELNDHFGHLAGDEALTATAQRIQRNIRGVDILARYGGDEFVIILAECDRIMAIEVAERVRTALHRVSFSGKWGEILLSASLGVADLQPGDRDLAAILDRADKALYRAKQAGRNCILWEE